METSIICERCNISTSFSYIFSCNHSLCSQCITRVIAFTHIKTILAQDQIQITCPCHLGTKLITLLDLPQLLENVNVTPTCKLHRAPAKFHCFKCELWLCEDCIEIHKVFNSHHQLTQGQSGFRKCEIHEGLMKDLYCHDCQQNICSICTSLKGAKHANHNYQFIKHYAEELRTHIPNCDVSAQVDRLEILRRDFSQLVDYVFEKTIQKMDELIQVIVEAKRIYTEKMKQILQRADLFLHLLKLCYLDFNNRNVTLDIHLLKDLCTWNIEVLHLELPAETEKKLKMFEDDFKEYLKRQPIETIQVDYFRIINDGTKNIQTLTGHNNSVISLIQMKDGRIASGSADKTIKIWEVKEKEIKDVLTLTGHEACVRIIIQMEDGRIASGSEDRTIKVWEVKKEEFKNIQTLTGHNNHVRSLIQLKDGRLASGSFDNTIKVWEVKEKEFKNTLTLTGHDGDVLSLIQLKDGRIASGSRDTTIKIWEVKEKEFKNTMTLTGHNNAVWSLNQVSDGRITSGSGDKTIKIWELKENEFKNTLTLTGHKGDVDSIIQLKDGRIVSSSDDKTIKVWEVKENEFKNTLTLTGHDDWVYSLIQIANGIIASGSRDTTIKLWE